MRPSYIRTSKEEHEIMKELSKLVDYNKKTGKFFWNDQASRNRGMEAGCVSKHGAGYRRILLNGKQVMAHRLAWFVVLKAIPPLCIDHVNGNRDDNRICNLRVVDENTNQSNRNCHREGRSLWGTTKIQGGKYFQARVQGRYLGNFKTPEQAHKKAVQYAIKFNLPYRSH